MTADKLLHYLPQLLVTIFAVGALIDLAGAGYIRAHFRHWRHPRRFYRVIGVLQLITAVFLAEPELRIWGVMLGGMTLFIWIVTLLNRRQWGWAAAGMLLLAALPASFAIA